MEQFKYDYEKQNPITRYDSMIREKKLLLKKEKDPSIINKISNQITSIINNYDFKQVGNNMHTYAQEVVAPP